MIKVEPLTPDRYKQFHGEMPPYNLRGVAVEEDKVTATGFLTKFSGYNFVVFDMAENASKRGIILGWRKLRAMMDSEQEYYAIIDGEMPTAPGLMKHFNFHHYTDNVYIFRG